MYFGADKCCYNSARALVLLPDTRHKVERRDAQISVNVREESLQNIAGQVQKARS